MNIILHTAYYFTTYFFSVANKWLHERGQEFYRPCTLENQATDEVDIRH